MDDPPVLERDVTAPDDTERLARGRPVKGFRNGSSPVGHQWLMLGVVDGDATDVMG